MNLLFRCLESRKTVEFEYSWNEKFFQLDGNPHDPQSRACTVSDRRDNKF